MGDDSVKHMPLHARSEDAGAIMVKPACSCGWERSALYPIDGHLVFAAYHAHLVACRVRNEEMTEALWSSAKVIARIAEARP